MGQLIWPTILPFVCTIDDLNPKKRRNFMCVHNIILFVLMCIYICICTYLRASAAEQMCVCDNVKTNLNPTTKAHFV